MRISAERMATDDSPYRSCWGSAPLARGLGECDGAHRVLMHNFNRWRSESCPSLRAVERLDSTILRIPRIRVVTRRSATSDVLRGARRARVYDRKLSAVRVTVARTHGAGCGGCRFGVVRPDARRRAVAGALARALSFSQPTMPANCRGL